jgi:hypothetical protein
MILPKLNKRWKYIAMDKSGRWSVYTTKPFIDEEYKAWDFKKGEACFITPLELFEPVKDWEKSVIRITK